MNIQQAKQIPLEDFLKQLGYIPNRTSGDQLWYSSPHRQESTPSFKVNKRLNAWYDFGDGDGGDIIDLIKSLESIATIPEALARISEVMGEQHINRQVSTVPSPKPQPAMDVISIGPVVSRSLREYLNVRGIKVEHTANLVREIHYRRGTDAYFGLAFANNSGGYEIRTPNFKGTLGTKDITLIKGNDSHAIVFEGFFDLLTAIELHGNQPDATIIVLNSNSLREKAAEYLRNLQPKTVELYRDRDASGEQLVEFFRLALPSSAIIDRSDAYIGHNDLNEWYMARREPSTSIG